MREQAHVSYQTCHSARGVCAARKAKEEELIARFVIFGYKSVSGAYVGAETDAGQSYLRQ